MWMFNSGAALGTAEEKLAEEIKSLIRRDDQKSFPDDWDPKTDVEIDQELYKKFSSELYGVLVSLVEGEPLGILRGLQNTKFQYDGYKAIVTLNQRFVIKTSSSMLASFLEVVKPKTLKEKDLITGIH
eukprot:12400461-Karenia_brevis.AAC.1